MFLQIALLQTLDNSKKRNIKHYAYFGNAKTTEELREMATSKSTLPDPVTNSDLRLINLKITP